MSRSRQNLPFKYRKQFDNFTDNDNYVYVKRLGMFFSKYPHVRMKDFLSAPYEVYPDEGFYDLKFYTTQKAVRVYGLYMKMRDEELPDSDNHISFIKKSLMYIFTFCKDNNLKVSEYTSHNTDGLQSFIMHLKNRHVSIYTLFGFTDLNKELSGHCNSRLELTLGENFINKLANWRVRYYNSNKAKNINEQGIKQITELINKL